MAIGAETVFAGASVQDIVKVPLHITGNDEVKTSVVVVVNPGGTGHPAGAGNTRRTGHVCEGTVTIVVVKRAASVPGDIKVFESIVVVIANGNAGRIAESSEARVLRDV